MLSEPTPSEPLGESPGWGCLWDSNWSQHWAEVQLVPTCTVQDQPATAVQHWRGRWDQHPLGSQRDECVSSKPRRAGLLAFIHLLTEGQNRLRIMVSGHGVFQASYPPHAQDSCTNGELRGAARGAEGRLVTLALSSRAVKAPCPAAGTSPAPKCRGEGDGCHGRVNARGSLRALCSIDTHRALLSQPRFQGNKSPSFLLRAQNSFFLLLPASIESHRPEQLGRRGGLILVQGWKGGAEPGLPTALSPPCIPTA